MIRALSAQLRLWRDDPDVQIVMIEGEGRAFCAGGDVRQVRADVLGGHGAAADIFFAEEYALNAMIAHFPKPYISLIQGACMGGGLGISIHGSDRVVAETALLAMPETAIGFVPDIGASYFLPRLPGWLGFYLGLTGARLAGADAVHAGLGTAFVPFDRFADLAAAVARDGQGAIQRFTAPLPGDTLAAVLPAIAESFSAPTVFAIVTRLGAMASDWAKATLAELHRHSPSALCWTLAAVKAGAALDLDAALAAELRLAQRLIRLPDFAEGVRAMLVDKDRKPHWQPMLLEDVDPRMIEDLFRA